MTVFLYCFFFYHIIYEKNMTDLFKELELSLFCHFLCNKLVLERHRCRQNTISLASFRAIITSLSSLLITLLVKLNIQQTILIRFNPLHFSWAYSYKYCNTSAGVQSKLRFNYWTEREREKWRRERCHVFDSIAENKPHREKIKKYTICHCTLTCNFLWFDGNFEFILRPHTPPTLEKKINIA